AAAVTAVVVDRSGDDDRGAQVQDNPTSDPLPSQWRTEYWHDVQVDVPADWGWGTAPTDTGSGEPERYFCGGPGATVLADGHRNVNADDSVPYVGRPIMLSDACMNFVDDPPPTSPYIWFDAGLEPGTVDVGDGYVQETVAVNGSTVTVATQDDALRERIVSTVTGAETCMANLDSPPTVDSMLTEGMSKVSSGLLCVYRTDSGNAFDLVYSRELTGKEGQDFTDATYAAPSANLCDYDRPFEYAVVTLTGDDPFGAEPVSQDYVVDTGCSRIETSPGEFHALNEANVVPWAGHGVAATMVGPSFGGAAWPYKYFIGMLG
ncbi:hypothetical protein, partial [Nocardioides sp.]|uniref:hypothetical protein n=1 Tax=Nocardioides sp. TaxID=35761 RepID=UPI0031FEDF74|nr:hypothetical protein [Nocardioides sp.]